MRPAFQLTVLVATLLGSSLAVGCAVASGPEDDAAAVDTVASEAPLSPAPFFQGDPANGARFAIDVSVWEEELAQSQMDCFWDSGVRHVVVGTQDEAVARQQLAMAVARGMTVDAYVFMHWQQDAAAAVKEAFRRVDGFPIGRMWLDVEEVPGAKQGALAVAALVQTGLDTCKAKGSVDCGIYTGPGFWKSYMNDTHAFTGVPLWYALYNGKTSLSDFAAERFGGWPKAVAKQYATKPFCGTGGADWDVMQVLGQPSIVVDRSSPAGGAEPPPAPTGLYPADGSTIHLTYAKLMSATVPRATSYQLALEHWNGKGFAPYYTWSSPNAYQKVSPQWQNALYRFRARAQNAHGWGAWSAYSTFAFGDHAGPVPPAPDGGAGQPDAADAGAPAPDAGASPAPSGVPSGLSPDGVVEAGPSVTLSSSSVANATAYDFAIDVSTGGAFASYFTYTASGPSQTFWPQIHAATYRFRVRAKVGGAYGDWSAPASFQFP